jgi:uncharacterized protein YjbI with pentapeptide repeats
MTTTAESSDFVTWRKELRRAEDTCPWPGPRPLRHTDIGLLVGRERDRRLFNHEVQNHRLILLGGESGVGKSSLLDAGLVPDLRTAGYAVVVCRNWGANDVTTNNDAFLARAVYSDLHPSLREGLTSDETLFDNLNKKYGDSLVIIFDQFEELLRYNRERRARISEILLRIHQRCAIRLVLSFRSEYFHELKDIETGATPFGISRYILDAVETKYALKVIRSTREQTSAAVEETVAKELADRWTNARTQEGGSSGTLARAGMLHLQAMLYALYDRADGAIVDQAVLTKMCEDAAELGPSDADLFAFGLQEAVNVKLRRCEAAANGLKMDRFLVRGAATVLSRTVEHLSSGGYKLVREAYDLGATVMEDEIQDCLDALRSNEPTEADVRKDTTAPLRRMLLAIAGDALLEIDDQADSARLQIGAGMNAPRSWLAPKGDENRQPNEFSWTDLLRGRRGADSPTNPAAGPMRGLSPADVLIEELRRFAWALVWLKESNLVRITRQNRQSMVSLIHDGFGDALLKWARTYQKRDEAWALYALTAPSGESHMWLEGPEWLEADKTKATIQNEISGTIGSPRIFGNLCFKGNSIILARFANTVFVNCDFRGTFFQACAFEGVTFVNCQLDGALFSDCTVIGRPAQATDAPTNDDPANLVPADPTFNVPNGEELARTFRRYRDDGVVADSQLISRVAGKPADAVDDRLEESDSWLPWTPAGAGLVLYGGRVSALTFRGTVFESSGTVSLRGVTGSGMDLAELSGANLDFHRCLLRHVSFTGQRPNTAKLKVTMNFSVLAQWWFGEGFEGSVRAKGSRLVQVWNDSDKLKVIIDSSNKATGIIGPADQAIADDDFRRAVGRTDYRRT